MRSHQLFCSACDRQVNVMVSDSRLGDHHPTLRDEELVCLEIGEKCTGALCPLGAAAPNAMVARLLSAGLPVGSLKTARSVCPSCGFEGEFVLFGRDSASCTICGTTGRWFLDHAELT